MAKLFTTLNMQLQRACPPLHLSPESDNCFLKGSASVTLLTRKGCEGQVPICRKKPRGIRGGIANSHAHTQELPGVITALLSSLTTDVSTATASL